MNNKNKKMIIMVAIIVVVMLTLGGSLALWTYFRVGPNQQLIAGDIYMKYEGTNQLKFASAMPSDTYNVNNYFEFTITGKNTFKDKDIVFDISLTRGDDDENRTVRIKDNLLKFRLVEIKEGSEYVLIQSASYLDLTNKRIWVDRVAKGTKNKITRTYRLYVWISEETKIGNTDDSDYDIKTWNDQVYGSIKVVVSGDFNEKEITDDYLIVDTKEFNTNKVYDSNRGIQTDEDIKLVLRSMREVEKFVLTNKTKNETKDYPVIKKERSWDTEEIIVKEKGEYEYYAVYPTKENSATGTFKININPDRMYVDKPTSELCKGEIVYDGSSHDLVDNNQKGYLFENYQQTEAGVHQVKAKLQGEYKWKDKTQDDVTIECNIEKAKTILTMEKSGTIDINGKKIVTINSNVSGTFTVNNDAELVAFANVSPSSGNSTTMTINGISEGIAELTVKFVPTSSNYQESSSKYTINVLGYSYATTVIKNTLGQTGGVIGVTTSNTKVTTPDSNIREYRYSGLNVNNYVKFNNEEWRIIGVFKENKDWKVKIVRSQVVSKSFPYEYVVDDITYNLHDSFNYSFRTNWNDPTKNFNYDINNLSDWSKAGLQYWLNSKGTGDTGYLNSLTSSAQNMISESIYYLGNMTYYSKEYNGGSEQIYGIKENTIEAYENERNTKTCSSKEKNGCLGGYVWLNNKDTWTGKIALMYPSDIGFSSDSNYWNVSLGYGTFSKSEQGYNTSWIKNIRYRSNSFVTEEWLLSPSSYDTSDVVQLDDNYLTITYVRNGNGNGGIPFHPTLYLKSEVIITEGTGTSSDPYQLSLN